MLKIIIGIGLALVILATISIGIHQLNDLHSTILEYCSYDDVCGTVLGQQK